MSAEPDSSRAKPGSCVRVDVGGWISGSCLDLGPANDLSALGGHFPGWEAWRGVSGLWHARKHNENAEPVAVTGENVQDLADEMRRADERLRP